MARQRCYCAHCRFSDDHIRHFLSWQLDASAPLSHLFLAVVKLVMPAVSVFMVAHHNYHLHKKRRVTSLQMNMLSSSIVASIALTLLISSSVEVACFAPSYSRRPFSTVAPAMKVPANLRRPTSSLNVWWFGGNGDKESLSEGADSCELVAVRIDRTSANSRRIAGEITVDAPLMDCWSILTDYNRLSIHVPNLVESKIIQARSAGLPGDGEYQCRLYQKGAQKIIGFEFGADVTMEMTEKIIS